MPFSIRRYFEPGELELIAPIISVTSEGQVIVVGGTPNRLGSGSDTGTTKTVTSRVTHSGLGDMIFKGRYYALEERDYIPAVDAVAQIKFPTASRTNGLGTGEFDEGFSLEFTKTIQDRYLALVDVGYTFIGSPPGQDLNNQWHFSLGPGYYFIPKKLLGSLTYEQYRALVPGESDPRDILAEVQYHLTHEWLVTGGMQVGLSEGSADFGLNFGAKLKF